MGTILAFAGSNSSKSVNYKLVRHTTSLISNHLLQLIDMADCPFPMYSEDYEKEHGFSNSLIEFKDDLQKSDGIILSVNEHNGNPSAYFKNLIDWLSRLDRNFISGKKILLMSTSPGKRGGIGAQEVAKNLLTRFGAEIIATFTLPSFHENLDAEKGITDKPLADEHLSALGLFLESI